MNDLAPKTRYPILLVVAFAFSQVACAQLPKSILNKNRKPENRPGFALKRPDQGRFVRTESGYMVPYEATIPGTDVKFFMLPIPGGRFMMGSPDTEPDRKTDEGPQFEVVVLPFWISKHELTWAEYKRYMDLARQFKEMQKKGLRKLTSTNSIDAVTAPSQLYDPSYSFAEGDGNDQPAATLTQFSAMQYSKWLSLLTETFYRLPCEAEWEYACRAGSKTVYYFGDDPANLKDHAWYQENAGEERHPVGKLKPNPWGLHDMYGNVAEWVLDSYGKNGYQAHAGKVLKAEETIRRSTEIYPRIVRGGSFESFHQECRSASRFSSNIEWQLEDPDYPKSPWWYTDSPATGVGFRLIRPLFEPESREAMEQFWVPTDQSLENANHRIQFDGKGASGIVDAHLPGKPTKKVPGTELEK